MTNSDYYDRLMQRHIQSLKEVGFNFDNLAKDNGVIATSTSKKDVVKIGGAPLTFVNHVSPIFLYR